MIAWLAPGAPFPPASAALGEGSDAPGLLAASRHVDPATLLDAYRQGIFPWYSPGEPVLWWCPDPRMVLRPEALKVSPSLRKTLRRVLREPAWEIRVDTAFTAVMLACSRVPRHGQHGTWITTELIGAYSALHAMGHAHSVETWYAGEMVGGLYGVAIGTMFYGESMFALERDASKMALAALCAHLRGQRVPMIDCQQQTAHLASLGAAPMARDAFLDQLTLGVNAAPIGHWAFDKHLLADWLA